VFYRTPPSSRNGWAPGTSIIVRLSVSALLHRHSVAWNGVVNCWARCISLRPAEKRKIAENPFDKPWREEQKPEEMKASGAAIGARLARTQRTRTKACGAKD